MKSKITVAITSLPYFCAIRSLRTCSPERHVLRAELASSEPRATTSVRTGGSQRTETDGVNH